MKLFTWAKMQDPSWDRPRAEVVASFRKRVWNRPIDGCWIWTGAHNHEDYGQYHGPWLKEFAHRLSYEINVGVVEEDGVVCHQCDTPPCVNPAHLFRGSLSLNSFDMHAKGRAGKDFAVKNARRIRNFNLIVEARALRWTADLVASSCCKGLSGEVCLTRCQACKKRQQVVGLHMMRKKYDERFDEKDPTYLLRFLTPEERNYVMEVSRE